MENDEEQCIGSLHKNKKKQGSSSKAVPKSQQHNTAKGTSNVKVEVPEEPNRKRSSKKISDCKAKPMKQEAVDDFQVCKSKTAVKKNEKLQKKMKGEEQEGEEDYKDCKPKNADNKTEKEKVKKEEELQIITGKKKEKKVYDLPGQKRDPPEEGDPLRIFYESLYKQLPESDMATIWMMESGLLPKEKAAQVFEKRQKKSIKFSSPMKAVGGSVKRETDCVIDKEKKRNRPSPAAAASQRKRTAPSKLSNKTNNNKRKKDDDDETGVSDAGDDDDDDFVAAPRKKRKTSS
ncbi:unnamed protein product [Cuscuta epithymum]|uniref:Uncharacterized protein n=1 Tax=Cuscuta epithymum TaxID=186058 RepID=A0AAV0DB11_9ASTE|nr:unnamed protein product [Cuscuta epithymum]